jgi:hypothetical protein
MDVPFGRGPVVGGPKDSSACITCHGAHDVAEQVAEKPLRGHVAGILNCHKPGGFSAGMATEY